MKNEERFWAWVEKWARRRYPKDWVRGYQCVECARLTRSVSYSPCPKCGHDMDPLDTSVTMRRVSRHTWELKKECLGRRLRKIDQKPDETPRLSHQRPIISVIM